jgi:hypothetical protein
MNAAIATNPGSRAELTATGQLNVAGRLHEAHVMLARSLAQARATASREQQQGQGRTAATRSAQAAVEQARLQYAQVQTAAMLMQSSGSRPAQVQAAAMALQSSASASAHAPALVPVPRYHVLLGSCRITAEMDARQSAKTLRRVLMEAAHFPPEIRGRLATPTLKVMAYADVDEEEEGMARDECCAVCQENVSMTSHEV